MISFVEIFLYLDFVIVLFFYCFWARQSKLGAILFTLWVYKKRGQSFCPLFLLSIELII